MSEPNIAVTESKQLNGMALVGFLAGITSIFLAFIIVPSVLAIVCSAIGLSTFDKSKQKGNWMSVAGLILGVIFLLVGVFSWMK